MDHNYVSEVCQKHFGKEPDSIKRFSAGLGNYVFLVQLAAQSYVFRCGNQPYDQTLYWLKELHHLHLPVSQLVAQGAYKQLYYMIVTYIHGSELGEIYPQLTDSDKRQIAKEVIQMQTQVAGLTPDLTCDWPQWVNDMLARAKARIQTNGYFDTEKVDRLTAVASALHDYFSALHPAAYLDDISTKNLLIQNGHVSGIIDVDWLERGDVLTFVALTHVSLMNLEYDTVYTRYLLDELDITAEQYSIFLFYSLLYCVDFMGERGTTFVGRTVPVNEEIIARLNSIYAHLWQQFQSAQP